MCFEINFNFRRQFIRFDLSCCEMCEELNFNRMKLKMSSFLITEIQNCIIIITCN